MAAIDPYQTITALDEAATHSSEKRKADGITYTPAYIAKSMVTLLAPSPTETILEPSCGRGVFLFALVEYWQERGYSLAWIDCWASQHLYACDLDSLAVEELKLLWVSFFESQGHAVKPLNVTVQDGLFGDWKNRSFDIILGNPPYVRIQNLAQGVRENIRQKYQSCAKGNVDLYYAFIEDALQRAKRVCLITPNSFMSNASAKALRGLLLPRMQRLIDFQSRLVFAPVRAYTSIFLCETKPDETIFVRNNLPEEGGAWEAVPRSDKGWSLQRFNPFTQPQSEDPGSTLGNFFEVLSGIATLADSTFLLPSPTRDNRGYVCQEDPLAPSTVITLPRQYAPRLLKMTKLNNSIGQEGPRILYPYNSKGQIEDETTLQDKAPGLLEWLERRRATLERRDKGKTQDYDAWYAYGRRQGLWLAQENERLLLLPQMGNGHLKPQLINSNSIGPFLFTSGFVVRAKKETNAKTLDILSEYLKTPKAWSFIIQEGKAWAGAGDYRTIGARALRRMPLPQSVVQKIRDP